ncbi:hypothetical protein A3K81_02025 [Candidatus Bathyarchaeota archaeon RBG_13_60_20]|nr:MAG: hypothetical protein A3K81_02025 [Candidatus Bathyarchaeota archaeon RBG_13_60_20]
MLVVVGSTSPVKIQAAKSAFDAFFEDVDVKGLGVSSGVKPFPTSDEETRRGALNRVRRLSMAEPGADYYVGLEGGLSQLGGWMVVKELAVVVHGGEVGVGVSPGYVCPDTLYKLIVSTSDAAGRRTIDEYFGEAEVLSGQGPIGVLTGGRLSRTHASTEAVVCALTRFASPKYY